MKGAVIGFGLVVAGCVLWTAFVLARAWAGGDLSRASPDCDPCGLVGYAGRMAILTGMALGTVGVGAAVLGWAIEHALRRLRRRPSRPTP